MRLRAVKYRSYRRVVLYAVLLFVVMVTKLLLGGRRNIDGLGWCHERDAI